jgi:hypothetical protein
MHAGFLGTSGHFRGHRGTHRFLHGMQEVRGSNPLNSTIVFFPRGAALCPAFLCHVEESGDRHCCQADDDQWNASPHEGAKDE